MDMDGVVTDRAAVTRVEGMEGCSGLSFDRGLPAAHNDLALPGTEAHHLVHKTGAQRYVEICLPYCGCQFYRLN